jgi:hypothetical protein
MNIRLIVFSGIMNALIGAMIGLAVCQLARREERKPIIIIGGASLGFGIGVVFQAIKEEKDQRDEEYEE